MLPGDGGGDRFKVLFFDDGANNQRAVAAGRYVLGDGSPVASANVLPVFPNAVTANPKPDGGGADPRSCGLVPAELDLRLDHAFSRNG